MKLNNYYIINFNSTNIKFIKRCLVYNNQCLIEMKKMIFIFYNMIKNNQFYSEKKKLILQTFLLYN